MEEDGVEDAWSGVRTVSFFGSFLGTGWRMCVPLIMSLMQVGSAKISRMYSGGLRCSIMRVIHSSVCVLSEFGAL